MIRSDGENGSNSKPMLLTCAIFCAILTLLLVITGCYNANTDGFRKDLNKTSKCLHETVTNFNEISYDYEKFSDEENLKEFEMMFVKLDESYTNTYERFDKTKSELSEDANRFFKKNYITAYQKMREDFRKLSSGDFSESAFREYYPKYGESMNNFIASHNDFISVMRK